MNTCGTCKHWGNSDEVEGDALRPCQAVIHDSRSRYCDDPTNYEYPDADEWEASVRDEIIAIRTHKAIVVDGSGYYAALKTQTDFGCVLHAERG